MKIEKNSVVTFQYTLRDEAGHELESNHGEEPTAYLHGANNIIRGLETAMAGRTAGDSFDLTLPPAEAYGLRNEEMKQRVPAKHILTRGKLKPGQAVQLNTGQGPRTVTVEKVGRHSVNIDANHPLAGQTLHFTIDVIEVREANSEEIAHGHAHGPGGHQH